MLKLFIANLKMMARNRQSLFWSFMFPLMFTVIFGFFFGGDKNIAGTITIINKSNSELAVNLEKAVEDSKLFNIKKENNKENNLDQARKDITRAKISAAVYIPEGFGEQKPGSPANIKVIYDPGNSQTNAVLFNFLDKYLTNINFKLQNAKPVFQLEQEKTSNRSLNYFDFVLVGILGLALMNSSMIGIGVNMTKYREDKILKRIITTPIKTWKFIVAEVLSRLILNIFQISLILSIGVYVFQGHIYGNILLVFLISLLGGVLFQLVGFVIAGISKTTAAAEGMATAINIPMMFLAGVFFPIDGLPKWLFSIVQYLPLAPLLRMIRSVALETASPLDNPNNLALVLGWIFVMLVLAIYKFRLTEE